MTTLTLTLLLEMIERAGRATPGPWKVLPTGRRLACVATTKSPLFALGTPERCAEFRREDADHIAACDPQTIIALCRIALAVKALRAELDDDCFPRVYNDTSCGRGVGGQTITTRAPGALADLDDALREAGM